MRISDVGRVCVIEHTRTGETRVVPSLAALSRHYTGSPTIGNILRTRSGDEWRLVSIEPAVSDRSSRVRVAKLLS